MKNNLDTLLSLFRRKNANDDKETELVPIKDIVSGIEDIEDIEYVDVLNDKANLHNDMRNIIKDLETSIEECKKHYRIEVC